MRLRYFLPAFALALMPVFPTAALSDEQSGAISQNCASIRNALKTLQKNDSRLRVLLGTTYQNILSNYISPLNVRLARNNTPSAVLSDSQVNLVSLRDSFSQKFIKYSQDLEELIAADCKNNPEDFYAKLERARASRAELSANVKTISDALTEHAHAVEALRSSL